MIIGRESRLSQRCLNAEISYTGVLGDSKDSDYRFIRIGTLLNKLVYINASVADFIILLAYDYHMRSLVSYARLYLFRRIVSHTTFLHEIVILISTFIIIKRLNKMRSFMPLCIQRVV